MICTRRQVRRAMTKRTAPTNQTAEFHGVLNKDGKGSNGGLGVYSDSLELFPKDTPFKVEVNTQGAKGPKYALPGPL